MRLSATTVADGRPSAQEQRARFSQRRQSSGRVATARSSALCACAKSPARAGGRRGRAASRAARPLARPGRGAAADAHLAGGDVRPGVAAVGLERDLRDARGD